MSKAHLSCSMKPSGADAALFSAFRRGWDQDMRGSSEMCVPEGDGERCFSTNEACNIWSKSVFRRKGVPIDESYAKWFWDSGDRGYQIYYSRFWDDAKEIIYTLGLKDSGGRIMTEVKSKSCLCKDDECTMVSEAPWSVSEQDISLLSILRYGACEITKGMAPVIYTKGNPRFGRDKAEEWACPVEV